MDAAKHPTSRLLKLASGMEIHHHEAGSGYPLVFLHGAGPGASGLSNYEHNYSYFVEHGYRTLMPDLIGWGESNKPSGVRYDYELLGGSLAQWLDVLSIEQCALIGNALGGALALRLALDHPKRVEKIVLLAPTALAEPAAYAAMPGIQAMFRAVTGGAELSAATMRGLFELMLHDPAGIDDRVVAQRLQAAKTQPADLYANLALASLEDRLDELVCPTLVFWGASDRFCPVDTAMRLLDRRPDARLITFGGCGHWVQAERAEAFNRLTLDFLRNG